MIHGLVLVLGPVVTNLCLIMLNIKSVAVSPYSTGDEGCKWNTTSTGHNIVFINLLFYINQIVSPFIKTTSDKRDQSDLMVNYRRTSWSNTTIGLVLHLKYVVFHVALHHQQYFNKTLITFSSFFPCKLCMWFLNNPSLPSGCSSCSIQYTSDS